MKKVRFWGLLIASTVLVLTACEDETTKPVEPMDRLEQQGILGNWKIQSRAINNISSTEVPCCGEITFQADDEPTDLRGNFISTDVGSEEKGAFSLSQNTDTITFQFGNIIRLQAALSLSDDRFTMIYLEDTDTIEEAWGRVE